MDPLLLMLGWYSLVVKLIYTKTGHSERPCEPCANPDIDSGFAALWACCIEMR